MDTTLMIKRSNWGRRDTTEWEHLYCIRWPGFNPPNLKACVADPLKCSTFVSKNTHHNFLIFKGSAFSCMHLLLKTQDTVTLCWKEASSITMWREKKGSWHDCPNVNDLFLIFFYKAHSLLWNVKAKNIIKN